MTHFTLPRRTMVARGHGPVVTADIQKCRQLAGSRHPGWLGGRIGVSGGDISIVQRDACDTKPTAIS
jgi:hypothetical protein